MVPRSNLVLHFPNCLLCTSNADIASVVVIWIPATDHPVAGCSESCFTFHCLMILTAPCYRSSYVFFILNIFKLSIQNCCSAYTAHSMCDQRATKCQNGAVLYGCYSCSVQLYTVNSDLECGSSISSRLTTNNSDSSVTIICPRLSDMQLIVRTIVCPRY